MTQPLKFLLIRRDNIGDLVCNTPMIRALRERYPDARIGVLVTTYNAAVLENHPDVDALYVYTKAKHRAPGVSLWRVLRDRLAMMWRLRRERYDYAILAGAHFLVRALRLARFIRPRHIIGFTEPGEPEGRFIDTAMPYTLPGPLHEVEDVFRLLAPLGIDGPPPALRMFPDPQEVEAARSKLKARQPRVVGGLIGIHISTRRANNRWLDAKYIELIRKLHQAHGCAFLLLWAPGDKSNPRHPGDDASAHAIADALRGIPVIAYPMGPLRQLIADISLCDKIVTSDGGALHIAAALGKPMLCFFGDTDASRWYPWGVPHVLLQAPTGKAADIGVEEAFAGFERLQALAQQWDGKAFFPRVSTSFSAIVTTQPTRNMARDNV